MKKAGWHDEWARVTENKVAAFAAEVLNGHFSNQQQGGALLALLGQSGQPESSSKAAFYAPLALMIPIATSTDPLDQLQSASPAHVRSVEEALVRSKPDSNFWFSGRAWDGQRWGKLQRLMPRVTQLAQSECAAHRKNEAKEPVHVSGLACVWLK